MLKIRPNFTGGLITFALSFLIIFIFFFDIFKEPNLHLFAPHGDGMKSTFCSLYHIEYDTSFWKTEAMNYPYGESVFFTGNQVFLTNFIKLTKNTIFDLTPYSIGIFNIWLLLSFAIGSLVCHSGSNINYFSISTMGPFRRTF